MTIVVLLVLAAIWAAVLLPPYLEQRRSAHPTTSIGDFRHKLAVLQRTGDPYAPMGSRPARPMPARAMSRNDALRRRRDVFMTLLAAAGLSFALALLLGGSLWLLHLTVDAALLGYTAMLLQIQQRRPVAAHRTPNVAYLPRHQSATQQALQRRSAN